MRRRREALERGEDPSNIGPPTTPSTPPDPTSDPRQNKRSKRRKK